MNPERKAVKNGLVACSIFFVILFVIATIHSYQQALSTSYSGLRASYQNIVIRKPQPEVQEDGEVKPFKHPSITKEELGNKGWTLLHLMTGNYPEQPDEIDQRNIEIFLKLFGEFYPCKECGSHFLQMLEDYPVQARSRKELMHYLCNLHNMVNKRLHKPQFDCQLAEEKWSECGCSSDIPS